MDNDRRGLAFVRDGKWLGVALVLCAACTGDGEPADDEESVGFESQAATTAYNGDGVRLASPLGGRLSGQSVSASFSLQTNRRVTFGSVVFALRNQADANLDFGHQFGVTVNNTTRTFNGTRAGLSAGSYTVWVAYEIGGSWRSLGAPVGFTVAAAAPQPSAPSGTAPSAGGPARPPAPGTWTLAFRDEFNGTSVNTSVWTDRSSSQSHLMQGNKSNGQLEWNQMANCRVRDGRLIQEARRERVVKSGVTYDWTSCLLTTGSAFTFQYGYIEERSRMPAVSSGMWPAFWTWQAPGANTQREVDVYEYWPSWAGRGAQYTAGTHGAGIGGSNQAWLRYPAGTSAQQYNVYGADIRPDGITFYLNGQRTRTVANRPNGPMSLITNLAVWADVPPPRTSSGAVKEVDYIRVWRK
jgi:beta-glucanase (GH16 family)